MTKNRMLSLLFIMVLMSVALSACMMNEPIRIGYVGSLSGVNSEVGVSGRNAMIMLVDEVNSTGGINGRKIELVIKDDENDLKRVAEIDKELIDSGVIAIIGHDMSFKLPTVLETIKDQPVVMISPTMADYSISKKDDNFFRVIPTNYDQGVSIGQFAKEKDYVSKVLVIIDGNNTAFGLGLVTGFEEVMGQKIKVVEMYDATTDMNDVLQVFAAEAYDSVLMVMNSKDLAYVGQRLREQDPQVILYSSNWAMTQDVIAFGGSSLKGTRFISTFDIDLKTEAYSRFLENYRKYYKMEPDFSTVYAYEAGQILMEVLQKSQKTTATALLNILKSNNSYTTVQGVLEFDAFGDVKRTQYMYSIEDGKFKRIY